jgi:hypothetical protein
MYAFRETHSLHVIELFLVFGLPPDIVVATLDSLGLQEIAGLEAKVSLHQ